MASHFAPNSSGPKGSPSRRGGSGAARVRADTYRQGKAPNGRRPSRGRKIGVVIGVTLAVLLVVFGACGFTLFRSAMSLKDRASVVMTQAATLKDSLKSGDTETLDTSVGDIQEQIAAINAEVHAPLWTLATFLPVVGQDISSVQKLGDAAVALVDDALVPIASDVSGVGLSSLFSDGKVNVELLQKLSDTLSGSMPTIQSSVDTIASLPEANIPQLADLLGRVQQPAAEMQGLVSNAESVLRLLPAIFGADGERTYLVIAQNNAEVRSTGGMPGSWGSITVENGVISLGEFTTFANKEGFDLPVLEVETKHIGFNLGKNAAQMTYTPNFLRSAELAQGYWSEAGFGDVDGVIMIDPIFLQRLLALTGGFTDSDGNTIDGTNASKVLLSDAYWKFGDDGSAQDEYFTTVAGLAFKSIMSNLGKVGLMDLVDVVTVAGEDGRLLVWMADEDEEELMRSFGLSGEMGSDPTTPELGVYFNDATWSKISWYLSAYTQVGEGVRNDDGTVTYSVATTMKNTMTEEEAATAPRYIYGQSPRKDSNSDMIDHVYFFAPAGGSITQPSVEGSGKGECKGSATAYDLQMYHFYTSLEAGESLTFTYQVTVSADATEPLAVRTTPLAQESLMQPPAE